MRWLWLPLAAVIIAIVAWRAWPGLSLPAFGGDTAAGSPEDDDDDGDPAAAPPSAATPATPRTSQSRRSIAPYDPWASPPPFDPRAPRLPDRENSHQVFSRQAHAAIEAALPELRDCNARFPAEDPKVTIVVSARSREMDGPALEVQIHGKGSRELASCLRDVVTSLGLEVPDGERFAAAGVRIMLTGPESTWNPHDLEE